MGVFKDITGEKYGHLTAIRFFDSLPEGKTKIKYRTYWIFQCDCGSEPFHYEASRVKSGQKWHCGCRAGELNPFPCTYSPTYRSWSKMKARCDGNDPRYNQYYRDRGITYCEEWSDFKNFLADMGFRPKGKTLDRIDVDGNYEPSNCRWTDNSRQMQNTRKVEGKSSQYKGVCWDRSRNKWKAEFGVDNKRRFIGRFECEEDAARAYDVAVIKHYGLPCYTNFPPEEYEKGD